MSDNLYREVYKANFKYMNVLHILEDFVRSTTAVYIDFSKQIPTQILSEENREKNEEGDDNYDPIKDYTRYHTEFFSYIIDTLKNRTQTIDYSFSDVLKQIDTEYKKTFRYSLQKYEISDKNAKNAKNEITKYIRDNQKITSEINEKLVFTFQSLAPENERPNENVARTEIEELIKQIAQKRNETRSIFKPLLKTYDINADESYKAYCEVHRLMKKRCVSLNQLVQLFTESVDDCAQNMLIFSDNMTSILNEIDSCNWFNEEMAKNDVFRLELEQDDFKPIDMSHKCFEGLEQVPTRSMCKYIPKYVGVALYDFECTKNDEMPLSKGQQVLIVEEPQNGWLLTLDYNSRKLGFVPEPYVNILGTGVAICRETLPGIIKKGEFIAVTTKLIENKSYVAISNDGKETLIPHSNICVIGGSIETL